MTEIVNFSMGICSAYIACRLQETCHTPICLFSDTKREDEDTYRFGHEVVSKFGLNFVEASDGRDLWDIWKEQNIIPARQITQCSRVMKIEPAHKWVAEFDGTGFVSYGYDIDEIERAERTESKWKHKHFKPRFYLIEWGVSKQQCFGYFQDHNIKPPRMYKHFQHGNCLPCKNFRRLDWEALQYHYPPLFKKALDFEEETGLKWMQDADMPRLIDLPVINSAPSRKGRHKLAGDEPAFSFDMGCDACAVD